VKIYIKDAQHALGVDEIFSSVLRCQLARGKLLQLMTSGHHDLSASENGNQAIPRFSIGDVR
jgi:hypothetical protein